MAFTRSGVRSPLSPLPKEQLRLLFTFSATSLCPNSAQAVGMRLGDEPPKAFGRDGSGRSQLREKNRHRVLQYLNHAFRRDLGVGIIGYPDNLDLVFVGIAP